MEYIKRLCRAVEENVNRKMSVASDFKWLAQKISDHTHEQISYMTLMRAWGYVDKGVVGKGTLNILAHFLGYMSYEDFREAAGTTDDSAASADEEKPAEASGEQPVEASDTTETSKVPKDAEPSGKPDAQEELTGHDSSPAEIIPPNRATVRLLSGIIIALLLVVGWGAYALLHKQPTERDDEAYILRKGQRFASYADYLSLFGITDVTEQPWSQPLPHHNNIIIFGGQYHHPQWGNEGDSADLLPTRTEHWHDACLPPEVEAMQNRQHYYAQKEINRLAITFMKNLVDTGFVFCGVYRMSLEQSDTTHVVWERVADNLDLLHLEYLEQLRN